MANIVTQSNSQYLDDYIMAYPSSKRRRKSSASSAGYSGKRSLRMRVPRAIATRGTADGYTEIPFTQMIRLYTNTSTGFWPTVQTTMASYGSAVGYKGIGFAFQPNNTRIYFSDTGATDKFEDFPISDWTNMEAIFDEVKISKIKIECWMNAQSSNINNALSNSPEIWMCEDVNDAYPPTSTIQEYSKSKRVLPNVPKSITITPHLVSDNVADAGVGADFSAGLTQTGYVKTASGAYHYGLKVWNWLPYEPDTAQVYYTQFRITFTRRFKRHR